MKPPYSGPVPCILGHFYHFEAHLYLDVDFLSNIPSHPFHMEPDRGSLGKWSKPGHAPAVSFHVKAAAGLEPIESVV